MPSIKILTPIVPGGVYHVYNRGNNYEKVFFKERDYLFFLNRLKKYLLPVAEFYAYALLPNHYHFLLRVKEEVADGQFSKQFSNFMSSYSMVINKREGRTGNLFHRPFKRLRVYNEEYLYRLLYYIHHNPESHDYCSNFRKYKYSSYSPILTNRLNIIDRDVVISWFDDLEGLIEFHNLKFEEDRLRNLTME